MRFLDRETERGRLEALAARPGGGLAVVWGRRRVGKTRLLLEWCGARGGVYFVADESSSAIQRRYFAEAIARRLPGFAEVEYPDWRRLLARVAADAASNGFRGPIVIDELPYLVRAAPELPSVLQQWIDHEARRARLIVALAGSSQRMMQGLVLEESAPLYGRAQEALEVGPLNPSCLPRAFPRATPVALVQHYAAWGGIPRYWELAAPLAGDVARRIDRLVLDPTGPLHREPDRLLLEELPPALEVRPLLDAIGAGVHRVTEIAGRIGRPVTSLARPLERLVSLGLARRETPFGEHPRSKRSLYRLSDPFFRLWFRVVAPTRGLLAAAPPAVRAELLDRHFPALTAAAWEDLCRLQVPRLLSSMPLGAVGPWGVPGRWWHGAAPEWDLVARSLDGRRLLLAEARCLSRPASRATLVAEAHRLLARQPPNLGGDLASLPVTRALLVPSAAPGAPKAIEGVHVVTLASLLR